MREDDLEAMAPEILGAVRGFLIGGQEMGKWLSDRSGYRGSCVAYAELKRWLFPNGTYANRGESEFAFQDVVSNNGATIQRYGVHCSAKFVLPNRAC